MIAEISGTVEVIPTDGKGGTAALLATGGTTITAVSDSSITLVGATVAATINAANMLVMTSGGLWAVTTGPAVGQVVPIDFWRKRGAAQQQRRNDGSPIGFIPATSETYKAFPASCLANSATGGWRVLAVGFAGVLTATLVLKNCQFATQHSFPAAVAGDFNQRYDPGLFFDGPFTIVPGTAAVIGQIEFMEGQR